MEQPILEVVVPTYNRASVLEKTLEHNVAVIEKCSGIRLHVIDNCSPDRTEKVCERFSGKIRYTRNASNLGLRGSFLKGLVERSGSCVMYLSDEDLLIHDGLCTTLKNLSEWVNSNSDSRENAVRIDNVILGGAPFGRRAKAGVEIRSMRDIEFFSDGYISGFVFCFGTRSYRLDTDATHLILDSRNTYPHLTHFVLSEDWRLKFSGIVSIHASMYEGQPYLQNEWRSKSHHLSFVAVADYINLVSGRAPVRDYLQFSVGYLLLATRFNRQVCSVGFMRRLPISLPLYYMVLALLFPLWILGRFGRLFLSERPAKPGRT